MAGSPRQFSASVSRIVAMHLGLRSFGLKITADDVVLIKMLARHRFMIRLVPTMSIVRGRMSMCPKCLASSALRSSVTSC